MCLAMRLEIFPGEGVANSQYLFTEHCVSLVCACSQIIVRFENIHSYLNLAGET